MSCSRRPPRSSALAEVRVCDFQGPGCAAAPRTRAHGLRQEGERMAKSSAGQPCPPDRSGSFFKLVNAFTLEIGELKQEMVNSAVPPDSGHPDMALLQGLEGEVSAVFLQPPSSRGAPGARDSGYTSLRRRMSVLDRLVQTHPVWLLLSLSDEDANRILTLQPPGTFLVRRSPRLQKKVISLRLHERTRTPVRDFPVKESQYTFSLEGSGISFTDLFRLVAFYCVSRDVLPFPLQLPEAIAGARTHTDLEEVAQLGADLVLEKAMHKCVLKPLKGVVEAALQDFQVSSGAWQQLKENLALARTKQPQELGVDGAVPPDPVAIDKIRHKFHNMCKMYSPEKKVSLLLRVCKLIYTIMEDNSGRLYGADDFLPMLTYVLAQCDMPQLDAEIQYMMELLDPALLQGEGGYYLTSAYGAMSLLKNFQEEQAAGVLSSEARNTLHQWHRRRTTQRYAPCIDDFQNYLRVALQEAGGGCTAKTLVVRPHSTAEEVCELCALKFKVPDPEAHALFLLVGDTAQQLAPDTHPQRIKAEIHSKPQGQRFHFVYRRAPDDRLNGNHLPG
ncbi:hypothetical protein AAFF_G00363830 [Aldrovandia affinis]|uniref:Ras and Rab interactor 2 n=1 Tax=Aldrovandia affinis TaxID=143900 RepID=A0AAD7SJM7_9TELE|nr:hypothetical protein AAFF_G00363830 [Aldrovandia affinis]